MKYSDIPSLILAVLIFSMPLILQAEDKAVQNNNANSQTEILDSSRLSYSPPVEGSYDRDSYLDANVNRFGYSLVQVSGERREGVRLLGGISEFTSKAHAGVSIQVTW